jgi:hypothetical protein
MGDIWLEAANIFFYIFHTLLILFNLMGWALPRLRKLHLLSLICTLGSWLLLGIWYGWGYCFLTDWHYNVLRQLGKTELPDSYISFLVASLSGWTPPAGLVNTLTISLTLLALGASIWVNRRPGRR